MSELVANFGQIFIYPYKNTTNEVNNEVRKRIATEMMETERSYKKSLEFVTANFYAPLLQLSKPIIQKEDVKVIFCNMGDLTGVHQCILSDLEKKVSNFSDESKIGDVFKQYSEQLKIYTTYVNNYDLSMKVLVRAMRLPNFKKFIEDGLAKPGSDHKDITAFLIQPVQRIPRYILLLSDLIKHTSSDHIDYDDLSDALEKIKHVAEFINESKRDSENMMKLNQLQSQLLNKAEKKT